MSMSTDEGSNSEGERYINQTDLGRKKGVSRQGIKNAANDGKIIIHGTGRAARIDLECPLTIAYLRAPTTPGKATVPAPPTAKPKTIKKKTAPIAPAPDPPVSEEKNIPPDLPANADKVEAFLNKEAVKEKKTQEELEKLKLANQKTRGELIERDTVQDFINGMHEIDNGQWKTLGLKISSKVAAELKIDDDEIVRKVCGVIDAEVLSVLKQIKRDQNRFLKKIGAEKIAKEAA